jgi:hypothetical protein
MVPVDALTRYSTSDGANGPPRGPEKAVLVDGVTISDGADCPSGLCCAAANSVNNKIAGTASKATEAIWAVAIMVADRFRARDISPRSDTQAV